MPKTHSSKTIGREITIASPGRINLIGEHTDYNMGYVLPASINKHITLKLSTNDSDSLCTIISKAYNTTLEIDLKNIAPSEAVWENYFLGVVYEISKKTNQLSGFDCNIESNLPIGSGLSSSAALECGLAYGLNELFNLGLSKLELISLSRDAEHHYVGNKCGIMDQFASVMGREGHVILLDCKTLNHKYIPIRIDPYKLVILNSQITHNLASSEYNKRRKECEEGVTVLGKKYPAVVSLREATLEMLKACKNEMSVNVFNRCKYVVEENSRVLAAVNALKQDNLKLLGELLYATHEGLRNLYEVSCPELDFMVDFSRYFNGVLGARVMGGGFGGCTINLVHEDSIEPYLEAINKAYQEKYKLQLTSFEVIPSKGTALV